MQDESRGLYSLKELDGFPYRYELHMHTAESSKCGVSPAADMVDELKRLGFTGAVITDHFVNGNGRCDRQAPWETQIDQILSGYRAAKKRGDEIGVQILFGWEASIEGKDYLTYGLDEQFLYSHPRLGKMPAREYAELVHEFGGFLIHAHPFRKAWYFPPEHKAELLEGVHDAVEIYNAGNGRQEYNDEAFEYAKAHNSVMTVGSDTHWIESIGAGTMAFPRRAKDIRDLISMIKSRECRMLTTPLDEIRQKK
ncbi:MAG: PHP domain-containing protein [Eubacteriales bacterium]|nr:PHP domain-containing protein [Eubacteriales bacterium]MDD3881622.1 PHP domain-containing protein [Eubacteriales bacterium]MDD4512319.1 PHP domain-containing protein [Eubacteriales bacterium]